MNIRAIIKKGLIRLYSVGEIKKKVLFDSFGGTQYSADPRAISEKMHEIFPDYEIVWALKPDVRKKNAILLPQYVRIVDTRMGYIKELATCTAYVTTEPLTQSFYKRKRQLVIQTWHGDRGLKKVLYEAAESVGKTRSKIYDDDYTDLCIAASNYGERCYRKAFKYTGKILKDGMPRNDKLINEDQSEQHRLREIFEIPEKCKVLTYAPTFRGHSINEQSSVIDINKTLSVLEKHGEKWICLLRAHEYSKGINIEGDSSSRIINVSIYPDMSDILLITDMLITDYSSCAGDYIVRRKPVILAINDKEDYIKNSRSLSVDLERTGFILSHNQEELNNILETNTEKDYALESECVMDFYGISETGHAAESVCRIINDHYIKYISE